MADYSIALGVKPLQLEDPLTSYGRFATIQNAQNQNALAQYQLAAAQRAEEQQNALYQQAQTPGFKLDFGTALGFGAPGIAAFKAQREAETQGLQAQELRGKIAAQPGAMAKTEAETARFNQQVVEGQTKALGLGLMQAMQNPDDTTLNSIFDSLDKTGVNTKPVRERFAAIPDLKAREQIIKQYALGNEEGRKALELVSPKPQTFNLGGKEVTYDMNFNSPTYKQEILSQAKGLTPGEAKPTISQVDVGNEVLTQSYDPVTGKITVLERRSKGMTPGEAKPTVSQVDTGNEIITQSYDPVTRKITVLERKPKQLTPEQTRASKQEESVVASTITDETGKVTFVNKFGKRIQPTSGGESIEVKGKPSATYEKIQKQKAELNKQLGSAITELTEITKDGGLIDQSTGSGAGRLIDYGAAFGGVATPGAIAIGKLKPIQDLVLKTIPRFEGPQSNIDVQSYKEAAGQLADPSMPTKIRKEAGKTVLRLMQKYKGQFATQEILNEGGGAAPSTPSVVDFGSLK
jgi:hypothetical protein